MSAEAIGKQATTALVTGILGLVCCAPLGIWAIIAGGNEWDDSRCQVKLLASKESIDVNYSHDLPEPLVTKLRELLEARS